MQELRFEFKDLFEANYKGGKPPVLEFYSEQYIPTVIKHDTYVKIRYESQSRTFAVYISKEEFNGNKS